MPKPKPIEWKNERRKVRDLVPAEYNPRQMTEQQAAELKKSLERFGLADPIVLNADGTIIGGHQRVRAMLDAGVEECDVRMASRRLSDREERELNVRLNKNVGEWDWDKLMEFDKDLLLDAGFDQAEMDRLINGPALGKAVGEVELGSGGMTGQHPKVCPECGYNLANERGDAE